MVEFDQDLFQFILCDRNEFSIFVNILADQSIHVFISATLPGSIRMIKKIAMPSSWAMRLCSANSLQLTPLIYCKRSARGWSRSVTATLESDPSAATRGQIAGQGVSLPIFFLPFRRPKNALNPSASPTQTLIWKRACTYVLVIVLQQSLQMIQDLIVASRLQSWRFELLDQLLGYILVR